MNTTTLRLDAVMDPQPNFYSGTSYLCIERHPLSTTSLRGTPAEPFGTDDRKVWVAYDYVENAIGIAELAKFRCPIGMPGDTIADNGMTYVITDVRIEYDDGWRWVVHAEGPA